MVTWPGATAADRVRVRRNHFIGVAREPTVKRQRIRGLLAGRFHLIPHQPASGGSIAEGIRGEAVMLNLPYIR